MQITIGDCGAIAGVLIYRPAFSGSHFRKPHIIAIGYLTFGIAVAAALWTQMARENARRAALLAAGKVEEVDEEEKTRLGDRWVGWRYVV
jgi:hypothetical protein